MVDLSSSFGNGVTSPRSTRQQQWRKQPQDLEQRFVMTPYGKGLVLATRRTAITRSSSSLGEDENKDGESKKNGEEGDITNGDNKAQSSSKQQEKPKSTSFSLTCLKTRNGILNAIKTTRKQQSQTNNNLSPQQEYMQVVELLEWDMATKAGNQTISYPLLYTAASLPSTAPMMGDDVICTYGRGTVIEISNTTGPATTTMSHNPKSNSQQQHQANKYKYKVVLKSWRLAGRSNVTCYLSKEDVHVVRKKVVSEMDIYERVEFAKIIKAKASKYYGAKLHKVALEHYAKAVDAVRLVQHGNSSSNEVRADLVEVMITCCNNASMCCWKLGNSWKECDEFARNALLLIDALYKKRGKIIHSILVLGGGAKLSDAKLFGVYKVKSLLLIARAQAGQHEYRDAVKTLKQAKEILKEYLQKTANGSTKTLESQEKEMKRQLNECVQHVKAEKQKEKARAQAMFGGASSKRLVSTKTRSPPPSSSVDKKGGRPPLSPTAVATSIHDTTTATTRVAIGNRRTNGKRLTNGKKPKSKPTTAPAASTTNNAQKRGLGKRRVSFHENTKAPSPKGLRPDDGIDSKGAVRKEDDEDGSETVSWLDEHKEALILAGVGGALAFSFALARGFIFAGGNSRK
jgi:tetratricopeptide (TPR) repeat protein